MPLHPARTRLLAAALLPILVATLWPFPGHEPEGFISCIACGDNGTSDVLLNIILFAPLGAALALHLRSIPRCALSAALLSATIELAQLYIPGRDSSLGDVVSNTLGGTLGALFTRTAVLWLLPSPARAARLSRTAALAAAAVCWATGVLLTPTLPDAPYYGQWTPSLAHLELYHGRVLAAMLSGLPIAPGPIPDSRLVRVRLGRAEVPRGLPRRARRAARRCLGRRAVWAGGLLDAHPGRCPVRRGGPRDWVGRRARLHATGRNPRLAVGGRRAGYLGGRRR